MSENNSIREEIDRIEPADGAKERMLRNIRQKAEEQQNTQVQGSSRSKAIPFGKIARWAAPLAACLVIAVVGIAVFRQQSVPVAPVEPSEPMESGVMVGSPFSDEMSPEELREQLGIDFSIPDGAENVVCYIMDGNIGDVRFEIGGSSYILRFSEQSGDFMGINGTPLSSEKIDASANAVLDTIESVEYPIYKISWTNGKINYTLSNNGETDAETIKAVYQEIK